MKIVLATVASQKLPVLRHQRVIHDIAQQVAALFTAVKWRALKDRCKRISNPLCIDPRQRPRDLRRQRLPFGVGICGIAFRSTLQAVTYRVKSLVYQEYSRITGQCYRTVPRRLSHPSRLMCDDDMKPSHAQQISCTQISTSILICFG